MTRWLPFPLTSVTLFLVWILINQSIAPAHLLLAGLLAVFIPLFTRTLQPIADPRLARPLVLLHLLGRSLVEIVRSAFNVSRIILSLHPGKANSQFIRIPLDLKDRYGLAVLSCLINSTPGTVWVEILPGTQELALHVFDLHDAQWWVDTIKNQYEKPLIEIFESRAAS